MSYKKQVKYIFTVQGEELSVSGKEGNIYVEETRKNGQEDTHFSICLMTFDSDKYESEYPDSDDDFDRAVIDYINTHAIPFN